MTHTSGKYRYADDDFYEMDFDASSDVWCGECITEAINSSISGSLVGDERVYHHNVGRLIPSEEPYQCGNCNKQNDAYENIGDEDD